MTDDGFAWQRLADGGAAVRWPADGPTRAELDAARREWVGTGVRYAQTFVPHPPPAAVLAALADGGFRPLTVLEFLRRAAEPGTVPRPSRLDLRPADSLAADLVRATVARTYVDSLDGAELNEVRGGDDTLDAAVKLVAFRGTEPVGVLMLDAAGEGPRGDTLEVAYLGVVPEARRAGVASTLVGFALDYAGVSGRAAVELCVDERNAPALALYAHFGFRLAARRAVWWWVNDDSA
jgi:ribosomal protein S18 acetylase RimI-like enzyme